LEYWLQFVEIHFFNIGGPSAVIATMVGA
jgi:hypothetical protein